LPGLSANMPSPQHAAPRAVLQWTVHLAAKQPAKAVAAVLVSTAVIAAAATLSPLFGAAAGWLMFASVAEFMLPVTYSITAEGVEARHLWTFARLNWSSVRRVCVCHDGVKLSPLSSPTRLEAFRGVFIRFGEGNRDAVLGAVEDLHGG